MRTLTRVGVTGAAVLAVSGLFLLNGSAGDGKGPAKDVEKIADTYAKGDAAAAKKQVQAVAKGLDDVEEVMHVFRTRKKKGLGVGPSAGAIMPDGIELMIQNLARDGITPGDLSKNGKALEQMGYRTAAVAEIALAKTPEKDMGKKTRKLWSTSAAETRDGALALAKAIKSNSAADVKSAATKMNAACTNCHNEFR